MKNLYCRHLGEEDGLLGGRFVFQSGGEAPAAKPAEAAPAKPAEAKPAEPAEAAKGAAKDAKKAADSGASALRQVSSLQPDKFQLKWSADAAKALEPTDFAAAKLTRPDKNNFVEKAPVTLNSEAFKKQPNVLRIRDATGKPADRISDTKNKEGVTLAERGKVYSIAGEKFVKVNYGADGKEVGFVALRYVKLGTAPAVAPAVAAAPTPAPADAPVALPVADPVAPVIAPAPSPAAAPVRKKETGTLTPPPAPAAAAPEKVQDFTSGSFFQVREDSGPFKKGEVIYSPAKNEGNELPKDTVVVRRDGSQVKLDTALAALQPLTPDSNPRDKILQRSFITDATKANPTEVKEVKVAAKDTITPSIIKTPATQSYKEDVSVAVNTITKSVPASVDTKQPAEAVAAKIAPPAAAPAAPRPAPSPTPTPGTPEEPAEAPKTWSYGQGTDQFKDEAYVAQLRQALASKGYAEDTKVSIIRRNENLGSKIIITVNDRQTIEGSVAAGDDYLRGSYSNALSKIPAAAPQTAPASTPGEKRT